MHEDGDAGDEDDHDNEDEENADAEAKSMGGDDGHESPKVLPSLSLDLDLRKLFAYTLNPKP